VNVVLTSAQLKALEFKNNMGKNTEFCKLRYCINKVFAITPLTRDTQKGIKRV